MKWIVLALFLTTDVSAYCLTPKVVRTRYPAAYLPGGGFLIFCAFHFGNQLHNEKT